MDTIAMQGAAPSGLATVPETAPSLSIVVPCRNEAAAIRGCLTSILEQERLPEDCEILVADGMSDDGTRAHIKEMERADPRVRLVDNPARTTPQALNIAIRAARGDVIIRMDAHTVYAADYVAECLRVLQETGADNVGGPMLTRAGGYVQRAVAAASHSRFAVGNSSHHQPAYEGWVDTVPYGCYRRSSLLDIGLFDEELVRNQDDELNFRLVQAGGRIWQSPRIRAWYAPRSSWRRLFHQYFQYGYWKVRVIQKRGRAASPRHWAPGAFTATLALLIVPATLLPTARWALGALLALYAGGVCLAATTSAIRAGWSLWPGLCVTFPCYHFGYGIGFLAGVWDFSIRSRAGRFTSLTRD
jgi:glycosyltransferase involved in cell wall biosynthesis